MRHLRRFAWLLPAISAAPAFAHSPVPGIKGFYTGLLHPFSTPSQALLLLGLGLLVGSFRAANARRLLIGFLIATFAGLLLGPRLPHLDPIMFGAAFAACTLAALAPGKLIPVAVILVATGGYLIGEASLPDEGPVRDRLFTMSGSIVGANIAMLYFYGIIDIVRERYTWPWVGIAFRVVAAWLGAISIVMLALGSVAVSAPS